MSGPIVSFRGPRGGEIAVNAQLVRAIEPGSSYPGGSPGTSAIFLGTNDWRIVEGEVFEVRDRINQALATAPRYVELDPETGEPK